MSDKPDGSGHADDHAHDNSDAAADSTIIDLNHPQSTGSVSIPLHGEATDGEGVDLHPKEHSNDHPTPVKAAEEEKETAEETEDAKEEPKEQEAPEKDDDQTDAGILTVIQANLFRIENNVPEYLLLKRIDADQHFWQPISAPYIYGEDIIDALMDLIREQAGIEKVKRLGNEMFTYEWGVHDMRGRDIIFSAEIDTDVDVRADATKYSNYGWFGLADAIHHLKWEGNKQALQRLDEVIYEELGIQPVTTAELTAAEEQVESALREQPEPIRQEQEAQVGQEDQEGASAQPTADTADTPPDEPVATEEAAPSQEIAEPVIPAYTNDIPEPAMPPILSRPAQPSLQPLPPQLSVPSDMGRYPQQQLQQQPYQNPYGPPQYGYANQRLAPPNPMFQPTGMSMQRPPMPNQMQQQMPPQQYGPGGQLPPPYPQQPLYQQPGQQPGPQPYGPPQPQQQMQPPMRPLQRPIAPQPRHSRGPTVIPLPVYTGPDAPPPEFPVDPRRNQPPTQYGPPPGPNPY